VLGVQQAAHFPYAPATKALHRSRWRQLIVGVVLFFNFYFFWLCNPNPNFFLFSFIILLFPFLFL
uniref:hypothetical protein n=1 Tax=Bacteria TaxID=2 RepID=UPI004047E542